MCVVFIARGTDTKEAKRSTGAQAKPDKNQEESLLYTKVSLDSRRCDMVQVQPIKEHMEICGSDGAHVGTVD